jgi:hypothetical protein
MIRQSTILFHSVHSGYSNANFAFAVDSRLLMETNFAYLKEAPLSYQETAMPPPLSFEQRA